MALGTHAPRTANVIGDCEEQPNWEEKHSPLQLEP